MSRIKRWLDMNDRLPELSEAVNDDPEGQTENRNKTEKASRSDASLRKPSKSLRAALDEEPF